MLLWRAALALLAGAIFMAYDMRFGVPTGPMGVAIAAGCLALMWVCGGRYYRGAWAALRRGSGTMDTLIATGTLSAWLYSTVQVLAPDWLLPAAQPMDMAITGMAIASAAHASALMGHGFFDSALMIVGFVGLGQGLELRARRTSNRAIQSLLALAPDTALRLRDNQETMVRVADIEVGDWLRVRAGERIAVDARVLDGTSHVDESMLTGEPMPVRRGPGDRLATGTLNGEHALIVEAVGVGRDTAVARIVRLVRRAQGAKPAIAELADRIAAVFVPVVLLIAVCTALVWWLLGPVPAAPYALRAALAVLIIACPCALGLATPLSVLVAVGRAAGLGVLIRDGRALELAGSVQLLLIDKTGTLTEGKPRVRAIRGAADVPETDVLRLAAALAANSRHPVSAAISAEANARGIVLQQASAVQETAGAGVEGDVSGAHCRLGQLGWMRPALLAPPPELDDAELPAGLHDDTTEVHLMRDGQWLGCIYVADALRADSLAGIARLRTAGVQVLLLSGDAPRAVAAMAARAGIEQYQGGVSPAGKLQEIVRQQAAGRVVGMVGDGINDAPALAAADVGFAMSEGAAVAVESADVTLLRQSLNAVADAMLLSRATRINIRENLFGAFIYNVVAIPVAAGLLWPLTGWLLSPMIASAAMAASSLTVVANALRLRRVPLQRFVSRSPGRVSRG